jgi:hypothetical protein
MISNHSSLPNISSVLLLTAALAGCGNETKLPAKLVSVAGTVVLDGKPLAACSVNFIPRDQTKGTGGFAVTDGDGQFIAKHWSNAPGIEPGTYTVVFSKLALPDGSPLPAGQDAADVGAVETLPTALTDPNRERTPHVVTVVDQGGQFTFDLKSR